MIQFFNDYFDSVELDRSLLVDKIGCSLYVGKLIKFDFLQFSEILTLKFSYDLVSAAHCLPPLSHPYTQASHFSIGNDSITCVKLGLQSFKITIEWLNKYLFILRCYATNTVYC